MAKKPRQPQHPTSAAKAATPLAGPKPAAQAPAAKSASPKKTFTRPTADDLAFALDETITYLIGDLAPRGQAIYAPQAATVKSNSRRFDLMYRVQLYTIERVLIAINLAVVDAQSLWNTDAYQARFDTPKEGKTTGWLTHVRTVLQGQLDLAQGAGVVWTKFPTDGQELIDLGRDAADSLDHAIEIGTGTFSALKKPRHFEKAKKHRPHTWGTPKGPKFVGKAARSTQGRGRARI